MNNYYIGTKDYPHHISVGAILLNDEGKVACHYYKEKTRNYPTDFYTLMHESVELDEKLEDTLHRGLKEEFSAKAEIISYVGSLVCSFMRENISIEKTVLYFVCKLISINTERNLDSVENHSDIKWMNIDDLITIMKKQGKIGNSSSDESKILKDVKKYFI